MIYYKDKKYQFVEYFNENNGTLVRSNVLQNHMETDNLPTMRSFPELIDIGIMGTCIASQHGMCLVAGVDCYQNAPIRQRPNMSYEHYLQILDQCTGHTFQIALGGAGDPNKHEDFERILLATREHRIVPNLTTSGFELSEHEISLINQYCGAVAVSYYSKLDEYDRETNQLTISAIRALVNAGCTTNVHYVLSKENVHEAIKRIKKGYFPQGINAIIFLLYKPVGLADKSKMLTASDPGYIELIKAINKGNCKYKIGIDSCQAPAIRMYCPNVAPETIEYCDAARFSMYIDCELLAYPCSFGHNQPHYSVDLKCTNIEEAWESKQFELFRNIQNKNCAKCSKNGCRNCALEIGINVCGQLADT